MPGLVFFIIFSIQNLISNTMRNLYLFCFLLAMASPVLLAQEKVSLDDQLEKSRKRWNHSLTQNPRYKFSKKPNALLVATAQKLKPGKALDIGMGQGRNTLYLAKQGWKVTGIDIADKAVALAKKRAKAANLKIKTVLKSMQHFKFGRKTWDLVTFVYEGCLRKELLKKIKKSLKPGGTIVFEFFHREAGIQMKRPTFGCKTGSIKKLFQEVKGFEITFYKEATAVADYSLKEYKLVKLVAKKLDK